MKTPDEIKAELAIIKDDYKKQEKCEHSPSFLLGKLQGYRDALEWALNDSVGLKIGGVYLLKNGQVGILTQRAGSWWYMAVVGCAHPYSFRNLITLGDPVRPVKCIGFVNDFKKWNEQYGNNEVDSI